ncbi:MAG: hypothetical protein JWQ23_4334 [Herminiimonas sp.]|nr:hypothetical protein [Herminiimonas sp.]
MRLCLIIRGHGEKSMSGKILIGCAGWSVPSAAGASFPAQGSHLERYGAVFNCVEINTSFYRPHRPDTYARWRDSVPDDFRFSVKVPRTITHQARLKDSEALLDRFLAEAGNLEQKLGCLLVQLPPSLQFDEEIVSHFFALLRTRVTLPVVCEPRHATWGNAAAGAVLARAGVAYAEADPVVVNPAATDTRPEIVYVRLHGSPDIYRSSYPEETLAAVAVSLAAAAAAGQQAWCIFDNTANGAAVPNALSLRARLTTS